jgi:DcuC family C4-dicarboxylate transporter
MAPLVVGSALLLGASLGGELLNPGAPELLTVVDGMNEIGRKIRAQDCVAYVQRFVFWHLLAATTVFCVWHWLRNRGADAKTDAPPNHGRVNVVKAFVPFVPIVLLFLAGPPLESIVVPKHWLLVNPDNATEAKTYNSRLIGLAMFVGVATAVIVSPRQLKTSAKAFFEGAGYAYVNIVALIVAANAFGEGVKRIGFDQLLGQLVANYPSLLVPLAALLPLLFGALSGSGMAATQSLYKLFVQPSLSAGADPIEIGAVVSLGAAAGRTMSPVAAVTLMCAKLTETDPFALARRVAVPLLMGMLLVMAIAKL